MQDVPKPVIAAILEAESDDRRFEEFCADLFSVIEGINYETTSRTGDTGVDARSRVSLADGSAIICATTQNKGVKAKAFEDIDKNASAGRRVARLHVCSNQPVKEETLTQIRDYADSKFPGAECDVHALTGITDLSSRYQAPFQNHFARELNEQQLWLRQQFGDGNDDDVKALLLRVAITTVFHPETKHQRELLLDSLILGALRGNDRRSRQSLAGAVRLGLKLTSPLREEALTSPIESLRARRLIDANDRGYKLTDDGVAALERLTAQGVTSSMAGRDAFREMIGEVEGATINAAMISRAWIKAQRRLSDAFLRNGLRLVAEVQAIASGEPNNPEAQSGPAILRATIESMIEELSRMEIDLPVVQHIAAAYRDMLTKRTSRAFQWLAELATKYLVICSLGLDPELTEQARRRIASWIILPDSHVWLSYLCQGDERHDACAAVLRQLPKIGASIYAVDGVLEECVHHADIADESFNEWYERLRQLRRQYPDLSPDQVVDPEDNAFVKGFAAIAGKDWSPADWSEYIKDFRGPGKGNIANLLRHLIVELDAIRHSDTPKAVKAGKAHAATAKTRGPSVGSNTTKRLEWDGRFVTTAFLLRQQTDPSRSLVIASDSDRLRNCFYQLVPPEARNGIRIRDLDALAYTLALFPGSLVNLECVREVLFRTSALPNVSTAAVSGTGLRGLRFSRRSSLQDRLDDSLAAPRPEPSE